MGEELRGIRIEDEIKQSYLDYAMSVIIGSFAILASPNHAWPSLMLVLSHSVITIP